MTTLPLQTPRFDNLKETKILSVVIPVYNREELVTRTLDSFLVQRSRHVTLIAVDNNSSDNSLSVVRDWAEKHSGYENLTVKVVSETTPGAAVARNRGLSEVDTPWVMFFDSDDCVAPGHTDAVIEAIIANPDKDMIRWDARLHQLSGRVEISKRFRKKTLIDQVIHCPLSTYNVAYRTDFIREIEGWKSCLRVWDDWELGVRALLASDRIEEIETPGVDIYRQEESITGTSYTPKQGEWEKALDEVERDVRRSSLPAGVKSKMLLATSYRRVLLASEYQREGNRAAARTELWHGIDQCGSTKRRILMRWAYLHTRLGFRGAWTILQTLRLV